ncbi:MAG TPA: type II secretion system protein [Armatimonadota bacterium]|nr:type II secretion system protein [Armatimonadota bacterium]
MATRGKRDGFTLIEMLTVIAIIGILASLIFPIVGAAKRRTKQAQCMSNMHQIFTALKQFQLDEHRYPDFIAGPVQWVESDGSYVPYQTDIIVPLEKSTGMVGGQLVSLFPEYGNAPSAYTCPVASLNALGAEFSTVDFVEDPMYSLLNNGGVTPNRNGKRGIGPTEGEPYYLYCYSSYDYQNPRGGAGNEAHYCPTWLDMNLAANMQHPQVERQLRWRTPPADTVVTWCSYHRYVDGSGITPGSRDLVLFLDGRVRLVSSALTVTWQDAWQAAVPGP